MQYFSEDYLMHHGVRGQKWGVRRYQNPDGSLTEKGKKRVAKLNKRVDKETRRVDNKYVDRVFKYTDNPNKKNARKYVKAANKFEYNVKLSQIKKSEIQKGFDYYEHAMVRNKTIGYLVGGAYAGIPAAMVTKSKYKEGRKARKDLKRTYRDRSFDYNNSDKKFNQYIGGAGKKNADPQLVWYDSDPDIREAYERQRRR